jgi:hypothetical protein
MSDTVTPASSPASQSTTTPTFSPPPSLAPTPPAPPVANAAGASPTPTPAKQTLAEILEQFVSVKSLAGTGSLFSHEGICTKCGWHTMQLSAAAALTLVRQHVQQHWRSVIAQL